MGAGPCITSIHVFINKRLKIKFYINYGTLSSKSPGEVGGKYSGKLEAGI